MHEHIKYKLTYSSANAFPLASLSRKKTMERKVTCIVLVVNDLIVNKN